MSLSPKKLEVLHDVDFLIRNYQSYEQKMIRNFASKPIGQRERQLMFLFNAREKMTIREVISSMAIPNSTVTSLVNRMEKSGYLKRQINHEDRRGYELILTEEGKRILALLTSIRQQWYESVTETMTSGDLKHAEEIIDLMKQQIHTFDVDDNRRFAMDKLKLEYDRFGPWIIEIKEAVDVPPQFERETDRILSAVRAIKIPKNIERRKLKPGMPMYDTVLAIYDGYIELMQRNDTIITATSLNYRDIRIIEKVHDLMSGHVFFHAGQQIYSFAYNPISGEIIDDVLDFIRERYIEKSGVDGLEELPDIEVIDAPLYKNLMSGYMKKENVKALQYQPFVELKHQKNTTWTALLDLMDKPALQESLFLTNGFEFMTFSRIKEVKKKGESDYGYRQLFIPLAYIKGISTFDDREMDDLMTLEIHVGDHKRMIKTGKNINVDYLETYIQQRASVNNA